MTITNNIVAKAAVAFVAVAMAFTLVAPSAKAQDVSSMSLEQLIALVNQLQSQLAGQTGGSTGTCSYTFTRTLGQGSTGADVMNLQKFLNLSADTQVAAAGVAGGPGSETSFYGPATAAAVSKFQTKYSADILVPSGLTSPTGFFGAASMAKANALCATSGPGTGPGTGTGTGPLQGGAGDLTIQNRTANIDNEVTEGSERNVVSFSAEADDNSDIAVTSVRVVLDVNATSPASSRANRYVEEVVIYQGTQEVGSADINDFSRSGSVHTATINLRNSVVRAGNDARFYVALVARDSISSEDRQGADIDVSVDRVRYEDATGAILTDSGWTPAVTNNVGFRAASADNDLRVQSNSATPAARLVKVNENSVSDEYEVFSFRLRTGSQSGDIEITEIPLALLLSTSTIGGNVENLINDMWMVVDGVTLRDYTITGTGTNATSTFSIDEGELVIDGNDTVTARVYVKFGRQSGRYDNGTSLTVSVAGAAIRAEDTRGNAVTLGGTANGNAQTANTAAAVVENFNWNVASTGTFIDFTFRVVADDEDFEVRTDSLTATSTGNASSTTIGDITRIGGTATDLTGGNWRVNAGDTATFRVRTTVSGSNGQWAEVTINKVAGQEVPDDKETSPTATLNIQN